MATQSVATRQRAAVRHHDALRHAGRPRGEEDVGGIVGPERGAAALAPRSGPPAWPGRGSSPTRRRRPVAGPRATTIVSSAGSGRPGALEHGDVVGAEEVRHRDEDAGAAAQQDDGRLGALEAGVDRHQDRAGGEDAERGHDPLGAVADQIATRSPGSTPDATSAAPNAGRPGRSSAYVRLVAPSARPPRHRTAAAAASMAGMEGRRGGGRGAHRGHPSAPSP